MLLKDYCLCEKELEITNENNHKICPDQKCKYRLFVMGDDFIDFYFMDGSLSIEYKDKIVSIDISDDYPSIFDDFDLDLDFLLDITTVEEMKDKLNFISIFL